VLTGHQVRLDEGGLLKMGRVEGISRQGELLLKSEAGLEKILQANEIRIIG